MIDSFHYSINCTLFQIELKSLCISEWIFLPPALINSAGIWSEPGDLHLFSSSIAISTSKILSSDTSGSAVCISFCLTSSTPCTFNSWEKWFFHLAKILWEYVTKPPLLSFYISSRLVTFLKIFVAPLQVPVLFLLPVSQFINFSFQIFLLYVLKMTTSFMSYIV